MRSSAAKQQKRSDHEELALEAQLAVADALGRLMEFWGFKRHMGRVWAVVYLAEAPLTTSELADVLGLSASATSFALADLLKWGAVKKTWLPGERRDYYAAETSIWKLIRRVFERRELTLIQEAAESFRRASLLFKEAQEACPPDQRRRLAYAERQVARLGAVAQVGDRLVRSLVAGKVLNPLELLRAEEVS